MRKCLVLFAVCIYSTISIAQNVGVGVPNPQNKLHVGGGFRLDTLTGVGGAGLLWHNPNGVVYGIKFTGNTNDVLRGDGSFGAFNINGAIGWLLNGNSGTNPATHFLGTTDDQPLLFRVNNVRHGYLGNSIFWGSNAGTLNTGIGNIGIGAGALKNNTGSLGLIAIGDSALAYNTDGLYNTALGFEALKNNTTGNANTAIGSVALQSNTTGSVNVATGEASMQNNTTGDGNSAYGASALRSNTTGNQNTALGGASLFLNSTGNHNTAVGYSALFNNRTSSFNTSVGASSLSNNETGYFNTAIGYKALEQNENGWSNTCIGYEALKGNKGGSNTAIGVHALITNTSGNENTAIGFTADVLNPNLSNATAIGYSAKVGASNSLVLGGTGVYAVNVGIGVTAPISTLQVRGSAKIFAGGATHTGNFWNGTSNLSGVEVTSSGNDAYIGIQRASGAGLHISKPFGSIGDMVAFFNSSVVVGTIYSDGISTAYNTTSDFRLKENRRPTQFSLKTLMQIEAEDYNYISDINKKTQTGFIAQELFKIYPQAVTPGGDDSKTNPWMIDYSKLTPLLVKAVQEQQKIIEDQNKKIDKQQQQIDLLIKEMQSLKKDLITQKN